MKSQEAGSLVVQAGLALVAEGLIARTWGNVSCRIDDKTFAITPSGRAYTTLDPSEIVEVSIEDASYEGDIKPSSEKRIHASIYRMRPDVNFIIHTHQEAASVVSAMNVDGFPVATEQKSLLGSYVRCADYALPGTKALCKNMVKAMEVSDGNAVIMKNHGAVCMGEDYEEAFAVSKKLEEACNELIQKWGGHVAMENAPGEEGYRSLLEALPKGHIYVLNQDAAVVKYSSMRKELLPYLDDFAQIVGPKALVEKAYDGPAIEKALKRASGVLIAGGGAICRGNNRSDAEAAAMLMTKNCKAYFGAYVMGKPKAIPVMEAILMRQVFLRKYSKIAGKGSRNGGE